MNDHDAEGTRIAEIVRQCPDPKLAARYVASCLRVEYWCGVTVGSREAFEVSRAVISGDKK